MPGGDQSQGVVHTVLGPAGDEIKGEFSIAQGLQAHQIVCTVKAGRDNMPVAPHQGDQVVYGRDGANGVNGDLNAVREQVADGFGPGSLFGVHGMAKGPHLKFFETIGMATDQDDLSPAPGQGLGGPLSHQAIPDDNSAAANLKGSCQI